MGDDKSDVSTDVMGVAEEVKPKLKRSKYERYAAVLVALGAGIGIAIALILQTWQPDEKTEPDEFQRKADIILWAGLIGDLFLRALRLIVLPLIFVSVILATTDMMSLGAAGRIGKYTFGLYLLTTLSAAIFGVIATLLFKGQFQTPPLEDPPKPENFAVQFSCGEGLMYGQNLLSNNLECVDPNVTDIHNIDFVIADIGFELDPLPPRTQIGLSQTLFDGIFIKIVSSNIVNSFATGDFAGIVVFAIVFGVALYSTMTKRGETPENPGALLQLLRDVDAIFMKLINWVIAITPLAVISLIIKALGNQKFDSLEDLGWLIVTTVSGMTAHFLFAHVFVFFLITRRNPFGYLRFIIPAQLLAFASASSAATLPVTMDCVKNSGEVPSTIRKFVPSLGATINMDGSALYFPAAITFLMISEGIEPNVGQYILMVILSTIGSAGTAPVPSASLVLILTAYTTVSGKSEIPSAYGLIFAIDFLQDRFRTVLNVTGDAMVARMVAALTDHSIDDDEVVEMEA